jgi:hypothetical protein
MKPMAKDAARRPLMDPDRKRFLRELSGSIANHEDLTVKVATFAADLSDENDRLRAENAELLARIERAGKAVSGEPRSRGDAETIPPRD